MDEHGDKIVKESVMKKRSGILMEIEKDLERFDRILLIADMCAGSFPVITDAKNILVLSVGTISPDNSLQIAYRQITIEQQAELLKVYHMYEFSDRFRVVSRDSRFGSIWNYVDAGILTEREALEAIAR